MSSNIDFTEGRLLPAMARFALPVMLSAFLQTAYGAVDLIVIGRFAASASISAVSSGSCVMNLINYSVLGLTMGSTVVIGQHIGGKASREAGDAVGGSIVLFAILAAVLMLAIELAAVPLTRWIQAPEEAFDQTVLYIRICGFGIPFTIAYNVISSVFKGIGNSRMPLLLVMIAAAANGVGDCLLCGLFRLDVAGAAIATSAAQGISVLLSLAAIRRKELPFRLRKESLSVKNRMIGAVLKVGAPLALQDFLVNASFTAVNSFANSYSVEASAGYGVGSKLSSFLMMIPQAVCVTVTAAAAQNVGAARYDRAQAAMKQAMKASVALGAAICTVGLALSGHLPKIFTHDPAVIQQASGHFRGFALDCVLTNIMFSLAGFFNGHGRTGEVMLQGLTGALLVRLPVSWYFSIRFPGKLFLLGLASPIASAYGILFFAVCFRRYTAKHPESIGR